MPVVLTAFQMNVSGTFQRSLVYLTHLFNHCLWLGTLEGGKNHNSAETQQKE
jgi:hypothetical protein